MSATKISENISNILNCYFSTCRKLNLLLVNSTYCIIPALLKQSTDQSTLQVLLLCSNRHTNLQKKQLEKKKKNLECVCYRRNILWWMFFIPGGNWKTLFLTKVCPYFEILSTAILLLSLKQVYWKKSVFYVFYLHSAVLITVKC